MWASAEGHARVVEALLEAGAEFRVTLDSGFNAIFFACARAAPMSFVRS